MRLSYLSTAHLFVVILTSVSGVQGSDARLGKRTRGEIRRGEPKPKEQALGSPRAGAMPAAPAVEEAIPEGENALDLNGDGDGGQVSPTEQPGEPDPLQVLYDQAQQGYITIPDHSIGEIPQIYSQIIRIIVEETLSGTPRGYPDYKEKLETILGACKVWLESRPGELKEKCPEFDKLVKLSDDLLQIAQHKNNLFDGLKARIFGGLSYKVSTKLVQLISATLTKALLFGHTECSQIRSSSIFGSIPKNINDIVAGCNDMQKCDILKWIWGVMAIAVEAHPQALWEFRQVSFKLIPLLKERLKLFLPDNQHDRLKSMNLNFWETNVTSGDYYNEKISSNERRLRFADSLGCTPQSRPGRLFRLDWDPACRKHVMSSLSERLEHTHQYFLTDLELVLNDESDCLSSMATVLGELREALKPCSIARSEFLASDLKPMGLWLLELLNECKDKFGNTEQDFDRDSEEAQQLRNFLHLKGLVAHFLGTCNSVLELHAQYARLQEPPVQGDAEEAPRELQLEELMAELAPYVVKNTKSARNRR